MLSRGADNQSGSRRVQWLRCLGSAPALAMLTLAPVAHGAAPHSLPICGTAAPLLPLPALAFPPAKKREERQAALCAHATCPRELRVGRRQRQG